MKRKSLITSFHKIHLQRGQSGLLEVTLNYKTHTMQTDRVTHPSGLARSLHGAQCCISVAINKASGLKVAVSFRCASRLIS